MDDIGRCVEKYRGALCVHVFHVVEEARSAASVEAKKVMDAAAQSIEQSRRAAEEQFRAEVSGFALQIAEKLVRKELSDDKKQKEIIDEMLKQIEKQN